MARKKRTLGQADNNNDGANPLTLDEILAPFDTNNPQDPTSFPEPPPDQDVIMLASYFKQVAPSDNIDDDSDTAMTGNDDGNGAEPKKPTRKRRRKGDPEPDHTALVLEKTKKQKRCGQACDRCHVRRFRCDEVKGPCYMCLRAGHRCVMTNRTTGEPIVRGGGEGVVVNFDDIQNENEEVKEKNEKLNEEIEQLRALNSKLQSQLQYFQSLASSIGAISGPNHVPVSQPFRILPNPNPQAQATRRILLYNHPHTNNNGNTLPISTNTNNNAFSGNMSIDPSASLPNLPFRSSMPNALPSTQWAQPHLPQGLPAASQNTTVAYPLRSSQVQSPMQDDAVQSVPIQDANNKGMNRGMQMRRLQDQGVQGHHLPMARFLDAQHDQVYQSSNTNTQQKKDQPHQRQNPTQNANELPTPNKDQGTYTHSLKTLNQSFQIPPHFLLGDAQNQSLQNANTQHEVKDAERQDFSNARLLYRTTLKNYPFDFPASLTKNVPHQATQSLQQPIFQFQGSGHQNANSQNLGYSNTQCHLFDDLDILGAIKKDYDGEEKFDFDFEPGFCWTPSPPVQTARPIPTTNKNSGQSIFSSIDLDTINEINQSSAANAGDKSASITIDDDIDVPYQTRELSSPEILSLLLAEMEEGVSQQKQSQPPVNGRVQELDQGNSDSTGDKEESQGNDDGDSDCFIAEPPQDIDMDLF